MEANSRRGREGLNGRACTGCPKVVVAGNRFRYSSRSGLVEVGSGLLLKIRMMMRKGACLALAVLVWPSLAMAQSVRGVTLFEPGELVTWAQDHVAPDTRPETVAAAIEQLYHAQGYLAADVRAELDADGQVVITVREGRVGAVHLDGGTARVQARVSRYMAPLADGMPVSIERLERQMLLAGDQAGMEVTAALSHVDPRADALLHVNINTVPATGFLSLDTLPQRPGTSSRLTLLQEGYSLFTGGDLLRAQGGATRVESGDVGWVGQLLYRRPLGARGAFAEIYGGSGLADRNIEALQLRSEQRGEQFGIAVGYPLFRRMGTGVFLVGEAERLEGRASLGGLRTRSRVDAVRAYLLGTHAFADGTLVEGSLRASFGRRDELDQGVVPPGQDEFASLRGEAGLITPIAPGLFLQLEVEGQLALTDLPEVEHFFLGHLPLVRGYAQGAVEADSGAAASLQLDRVFLPTDTSSLTVSAFTDLGFVRRRGADPGFVQDADIGSVGVGASLAVLGGRSLNSWVALPLADSRLTEAGDPVAYIRLTQRW